MLGRAGRAKGEQHCAAESEQGTGWQIHAGRGSEEEQAALWIRNSGIVQCHTQIDQHSLYLLLLVHMAGGTALSQIRHCTAVLTNILPILDERELAIEVMIKCFEFCDLQH